MSTLNNMEDLFASLTAELAVWVSGVTGVAVLPEAFRVPREAGQLSLGTFVSGGAEEAVQALRLALPACPAVREVREKNGWLLFWLSDGWFDGLIAWAEALKTRPAGSYLENRMAILARKGEAPCPKEERVRQALWAAYLAFRRGAWRPADERMALTMTHGRRDVSRIELEACCGSVAAAILKLRGEAL